MGDPLAWRDARGRAFWLVFVGLGLLAVLVGFAPPAIARFSGGADYPANWPLVIHVWSIGAWLVLLLGQLALAASGRIGWHRRLGLSAFALIPLVVVSGFWAEVLSERFWEARYPDYVRFLAVPVAQMGGFGLFGALALAWRREPLRHRRMILLAAASLLSAAWGRALAGPVDALLQKSGPFLADFLGYHFGFIVMVLAAVLFDWRTRGAVHPSLGWGGGLMVLAMAVLTMLALSDWWPPFARALIGYTPA